VNTKQQEARELLQLELRARRGIVNPLPDKGESEGGKYFFTDVQGVTVIIGLGGGYQIPAVRSYPETGKPGETALDAAVCADEHFKKQEKSDCSTGHFGPVVNTEWSCNDVSCHCNKESDILRFSRSVK
jgi:hypothetical protein